MNLETLKRLGFRYQEKWSNSYRECFVSGEALATLSITEGDLSISLHASKDGYDKELEEAEAFYAAN